MRSCACRRRKYLTIPLGVLGITSSVAAFVVFLFFLGTTADMWAKSISKPQRCCLTALSTLTLIDLSVNSSADEVGGAEVFLNFPEGLQAIKYSYVNRHTSNITFTSTVVMDYKQGSSYEILKKEGGVTLCFQRSLPVLAPAKCVPSFATLVTSDDSETVWRADQPHLGPTLTYTFASDTCEPLYVRQKGQHKKISVDMDVRVTNYIKSIDDMDVFHHPANCSFTSQPLRLPFPWTDLSLSNYTSDQKEFSNGSDEKVQFLFLPLLGSRAKPRRPRLP